jgi:hypothetical protein
MTADEAREALEEELGGPFTETSWSRLYRDEVRHFLEDQRPETWQNVKDLAEDLFEYEKQLKQELASGGGGESTTKRRRLGQRKSRQKEEAKEEHWFPELSREEMLRVEVYGEYLAKVAAADYYVARYRERVLGEPTATLTPYQAHSLARSAAARALRPSFFRRMRIPVGDHNVEVLHHESVVDEGDSAVDHATIRVRWTEKPEGIEQRVPSAATEGKDLACLEFKNEEGEDDFIDVQQDSVLGELQRLASRLTAQFPWREAQATWFILTGEPPLVPPVKVRYTLRHPKVRLRRFGDTRRFTYGEVTISAAPWVSETIVTEAYYNLQSHILPGEQNRPLERRRLELLRFVLQKENPLRLTRARRMRIGKELVEAWDRKYPNWSYGAHKQPTSAFWDAYNDAERQVLHPSWTDPLNVSQTGEDGSS